MKIHDWFGLSYSSYLVMPRTMLQSMPDEWQEKFVEMIEQCNLLELPKDYTNDYRVTMIKDKKFYKDPLRNYERGRRKLPLK